MTKRPAESRENTREKSTTTGDERSAKRARFACPYGECVEKRRQRLPQMRTVAAYANRRSMTRHLRSVHRRGGDEARDCPFSDCGDDECARGHLIDWHRAAVCGENAWRCAACATMYAQAGSLEKHRWLQHRQWPDRAKDAMERQEEEEKNACEQAIAEATPKREEAKEEKRGCGKRERTESKSLADARFITTIAMTLVVAAATTTITNGANPRGTRAKTPESCSTAPRSHLYAKARRRSWLEDPPRLSTRTPYAARTPLRTLLPAADVT